MQPFELTIMEMSPRDFLILCESKTVIMLFCQTNPAAHRAERTLRSIYWFKRVYLYIQFKG